MPNAFREHFLPQWVRLSNLLVVSDKAQSRVLLDSLYMEMHKHPGVHSGDGPMALTIVGSVSDMIDDSEFRIAHEMMQELIMDDEGAGGHVN